MPHLYSLTTTVAIIPGNLDRYTNVE